MFYVMKGAQVEPLIQFSNLDITQETSGSLTLSLTSLNTNNNPGHNLLVEEAIVFVDDKEFRIKQLSEYRTHKEIQCVSTFFDLIDTRRNTLFDKDFAPLEEYLEFIFENTSWDFTTNINTTNFITDFGNSNIVDLLNRLCETIGAWYEIKSNKNVVIHDNLATAYYKDFQYRYGSNIHTLSRHVDTTNLKTFIRGYGANGLTTTYTAPTASTFGIREADPIRNNKIESEPELKGILGRSIVSEPQISIELDSIELLNRDIGERVWLIYEPLDIELSTTIMSTHKTIVGDEVRTYKVVIGNSVPKNASDLFVETRKFIEDSKKELSNQFSTYQNTMRKDMENLMVLGVPEIY